MMKRFAIILFLSLAAFPARTQAPSHIRIAYGPYLQSVTETGATVVWVTDRPAVSWVEIAPDDGSNFYAAERPRYYQTEMGKKAIGTLHKIPLRGLEPGTAYRYRIFSHEVTEQTGNYVAYGRVASSGVYGRMPLLFRTFDADKSETSFIIVNDVHEDNENLAELMGHADPSTADFIVFNGDMAHKLDSEEQLFASFMQTASELFAAEKPVCYARGNHEARGTFSSRFMDYFPTPTGLPYYTFRDGPAFFVVLDGGEDKPDSDIEYYGTAAYDGYRREQAEWLKGVLASDEFRNAPVRIAILHIPPVRATWHGAVETAELFAPMLGEAGIDIMFSGHLHSHIYVPAGEENCDFPVLVNSNRNIVKCRVSGEGVSVRVIDRGGNTVQQFEIR